MTWKEENNTLQASLRFPDFATAWAFMTEVAFLAEKMNHHPSWSNTYNFVHITLCTHDEGDIVTEKDIKMAEKISFIYRKYHDG